MIGYRHADSRFPFLWESEEQPEGRWHGLGEGPAHYFADSPDGAWAEFLRHEEISDPADLETIQRAIWVVNLDENDCVSPELPMHVLLGGPETYTSCQQEAQRLRTASEHACLVAPSAALKPQGAIGWTVNNGMQPVPTDGKVIVLYGYRSELVGWRAAIGKPSIDLLKHVKHF